MTEYEKIFEKRRNFRSTILWAVFIMQLLNRLDFDFNFELMFAIYLNL